ncbi:MAG TPA: transcription antitermination factor NusB [Polyangia bacterium]
MASPRRQGREVALQILCGVDGNPDFNAAAALQFYANQVAGSEDEEAGLPAADAYDRGFAESLISRATEQREQVDDAITKVSRTWRLDRMARVDRNILRLAVTEFLFFPEIPARVTINEAVELAKRYGAAESPAFVNGLLDSALKTLELRK